MYIVCKIVYISEKSRWQNDIFPFNIAKKATYPCGFKSFSRHCCWSYPADWILSCDEDIQLDSRTDSRKYQ